MSTTTHSSNDLSLMHSTESRHFSLEFIALGHLSYLFVVFSFYSTFQHQKFYWHLTWISITTPKGFQIFKAISGLFHLGDHLGEWKSSPLWTIPWLKFWEVDWPMVLVCLGLKGFPGYGTVFAKTGKLPRKSERVGHPIRDIFLLPGFSKILGEHHELFLLPLSVETRRQGSCRELWSWRRWYHHDFCMKGYGGFAPKNDLLIPDLIPKDHLRFQSILSLWD